MLGFGAGALISAVSFELAEEGAALAGGGWLGLGLALGAITYYVLDGKVAAMGSGGALALGAFLDGIPEQAVLGIGLAAGEGVSVGLLAAIFVSNLPEAIGSAAAMRADGRSGRQILQLWGAVALICTLATVGGYAIGRCGERRAQGCDQRLRRRRPDRDAGRLDDPGGDGEGRAHHRAAHHSRLRRSGGPLRDHLTD